MKKITILIAAAVFAFVVTPFLVGVNAEKQLRAMYDRIDLGGVGKIVVTDYQKGWFGATARTEFRITAKEIEEATDDIVLAINHQIQHGPILFGEAGFGLGLLEMELTLEMPSILKQELPDIDERINELISIYSRLGFDGGLHSIGSLKAFDFIHENTRVDVMTASTTSRVTPNGKVVAFGNWGGMSISDSKEFGLTLGKSTFDMELQAVGGNVFTPGVILTGTTEGRIESFRMRPTMPASNFNLSDLAITTDSRISDDRLKVDLDLSIKDVEAAGQIFTDFTLQQSIQNLDVKTLQAIGQLNRDMTPQNSEKKMQELAELGMQLIASEPSLDISKLGITTLQGPIQMNLHLGINPDLVESTMPESITQALEVRSAGSVPQAYLESLGLDTMIKEFVNQQMLRIDGDRVTFEMAFEQGQLSVYGKPLNIPQ